MVNHIALSTFNKKIMLYLLFFFILGINSIFAQPDNFDISGAKPGMLDTLALQTSQKNVIASEGILEKEINPDKYILGPGDLLHLSLVTTRSKDYEIRVSPEGKVILPEAGILDVKGKSLTEAIDLIKNRLSKVYKSDNIYLVLKELRKFKVIITGAIKKTGIITATAVDRVSEVIEKAGGLKPDASIRKIKLFRNEGKDILNIDLVRFFKSNDEAANPTVLGGDHIVIPPSSETQIIGILGEVPSPGEYEYHDGDSLSTIIKFAQGFYASSYLDSVEFISLSSNGTGIIKQYLNLSSWRDKIFTNEILEGDFPLKSGNRIYIRKNPTWRDVKEVAIAGEVNYPGRYAVDERTIRVTDIIGRAGGLTDNASLDATMLVRKSEIGKEDKEMVRLSKIPSAEMSENELRYYQARIVESPGLMALDFKKIMSNYNSDDNIILINKDSIFVPSQKYFVNVQGRVNNPGLVIYKPAFTYLDYILLAGGFGFRSDPKSTLIVKSKGQQYLAQDRNYKIEPGDNILVPPETEIKIGDLLAKGLTIITQIVTIAGVVIAVMKTK